MQKVRPPREADYDTVVADDLRPAGDGKHCFYCARPLGSKHKLDCIIRLGAGQYLVAIRHNPSGEIRMYRQDMTWDDDEFMWTEGNYSCDCNRYLFFERAAGNEPDWDLAKCGDELYTALYAELPPDGRHVTLDSTDSGEGKQ